MSWQMKCKLPPEAFWDKLSGLEKRQLAKKRGMVFCEHLQVVDGKLLGSCECSKR